PQSPPDPDNSHSYQSMKTQSRKTTAGPRSGLKKSCFLTAKVCFFISYLLITSSLIIFTLFEFFPGLLDFINLDRIMYFQQRTRFSPHSKLVFTSRKAGRHFEYRLRGDLYAPQFGFKVRDRSYIASYNRYGFRTNSSRAPFDVLMIGDSYIEIGETDQDTISEKLKEASGLSVFNMGREWYGPDQYNELLKEYGQQLKPRYAIFCFFEGNDIDDVREYLSWLHGGNYHHLAIIKGSFWTRYFIALKDSYAYLRSSWQRLRQQRPGTRGSAQVSKSTPLHPELAIINLPDKKVVMRFGYWNAYASKDHLLQCLEFRRLRILLDVFKNHATSQGIIPLLLYIPTKAQIYGSFYSSDSGQLFLDKITKQLHYENNSVDAVLEIAHDLDLKTLNLLPYFKQLASQGSLLYYPFDTHWNIVGREAAADFMASYFKQLDGQTTPSTE
ncbi:hypothetical protein ACFL27_27235, partial [candidate division CSSED10-310 bacterium]